MYGSLLNSFLVTFLASLLVSYICTYRFLALVGGYAAFVDEIEDDLGRVIRESGERC